MTITHQEEGRRERLDYSKRHRKAEWRHNWFRLRRLDDYELLRVIDESLGLKKEKIEKQKKDALCILQNYFGRGLHRAYLQIFHLFSTSYLFDYVPQSESDRNLEMIFNLQRSFWPLTKKMDYWFRRPKIFLKKGFVITDSKKLFIKMVCIVFFSLCLFV